MASLFMAFSVCSPISAMATIQIPEGTAALSRDNASQNLQNLWQDIAEFFGWGDQPSKWSDVKSWQPVGNRFATAYGDDGQLLALYDLSYPSLWKKVSLGVIGSPMIGPSTLIDTWNQGLATATDVPPAIMDAINALGSIPKDVMSQDLFPKDWWKSVPWVNGTHFVDIAPQSFRLTDMNLSQLNLGGGLVSTLRQLYSNITDVTDNLSDQDVLGAFRFVQARDGGYEIQWDYPTRACSLDFSVSKPRKLLDFKNTRGGLYENLRFQLLEVALSQGADYIPIPVVQAVVATAISRLAHYYQMTVVEHLEMLHQLFLDGSDPVLNNMSDDDHGSFIEAFELTRTTPDSGWEWIFSSTDSVWNKGLTSDANTAEASRSWLRAHGNALWEFNPQFMLATDAQNQRFLYLASQQAPKNNSGPIVSIDYQNEAKVIDERIFMQLVDVGVEFASHFVPTAGSLVGMAYNYLVENRIDATQYWEARLVQHLEQRPDASQWQSELAVLEAQRINPFEINRTEMNQLIADRRKLIGL